jgi:hypothetical protein
MARRASLEVALATVARRASEGHKVDRSTGLRDVVVPLDRASGYRAFRQLPLFEYASATSIRASEGHYKQGLLYC